MKKDTPSERTYKVKVYYTKELECKEVEVKASNYREAELKAANRALMENFNEDNSIYIWAVRANGYE